MSKEYTSYPIQLLPAIGHTYFAAFQICRPGESPVFNGEPLRHYDSLEEAMTHFAGICRIAKQRNEPIPYLLLSAPVA